jgi:hypothetical protein
VRERDHGLSTYLTPKTYLDSFTLAKQLLRMQAGKLEDKRIQVKSGLRRIQETNASVNTMGAELEALQLQLEQSQRDLRAMLKQLEIDKAEMNSLCVFVETERDLVRQHTERVGRMKEEGAKMLFQLNGVKTNSEMVAERVEKRAITELRSAQSNPAVQASVECMCVLVGAAPSWKAGRDLINYKEFFKMLKSKTALPEAELDKADRLLEAVRDGDPDGDTLPKGARQLQLWEEVKISFLRYELQVAPHRFLMAEAEAEAVEFQERLQEKEPQQFILAVVGLQERQVELRSERGSELAITPGVVRLAFRTWR